MPTKIFSMSNKNSFANSNLVYSWVALAHTMNGHSTQTMQINNTPLTTGPMINVPSSSTISNGVPLMPSILPIVTRTPTDRKQVLKHLTAALESLKKVSSICCIRLWLTFAQDYFKPTESTVQKRIKQMNLPLQKMDWEEILSIAKAGFFSVEGEKPSRTIFPPSGPFEGVDPSHPNVDKFPQYLWRSLQQFFINAHPVVKVGRYGFAVYLKEEGPPEVREMPLGRITELVQLALHKQLLKYHKTQVSTLLPDSENGIGDVSSPRADGFNPWPNPTAYYGAGTVDDSHLIYPPSNDFVSGYDPLDGAEEILPEDDRSNYVDVTFTWPHPGTSVFVTGSFLNWRATIPLHRTERDPSSSPIPSPTPPNPPQQPTRENNNYFFGVTGATCEPRDVFSTAFSLPPGRYEYKFIVDGAWHYDPRQPVVVCIAILTEELKLMFLYFTD